MMITSVRETTDQELVEKGPEGIFWDDGTTSILIWVVTIQMHTYVKIQQAVYLRDTYFSVYKLYFQLKRRKKIVKLFYIDIFYRFFVNQCQRQGFPILLTTYIQSLTQFLVQSR